MSCPFSSESSSASETPRVLPQYFLGKEDDPLYPFADYAHVERDLDIMRGHLPRVLAVLSNLNFKHGTSDRNPENALASAKTSRFFLKFPSAIDDAVNMRYIVPDLDRLMSARKFYMIGFFSKILQDSPVISHIWNLDEKLVDRVFSFPSILGYVTCRTDNGTYFNYVFLENADAVDKWRGLRTHDSAVSLSAHYYEYVRINHAILPLSMQQLMDDPRQIRKLQIHRTKYCKYDNGSLIWEGMRKHRPDKVFHSVPVFHEPRPLLFASFAGHHDLQPYADIVSFIGKVTGLPVKMVDIVALSSGKKPASDIDLMVQHGIDFAFTRTVPSLTSLHSMMIPIAAPVRTHYNERSNFVIGMLDDVGLYLAPPVVCSRWVATADKKAVTHAITSASASAIPALRTMGITRYASVHKDNYQPYSELLIHS